MGSFPGSSCCPYEVGSLQDYLSRVAFKVPLKILDAAWQRPGVREEKLNPVIPMIEIPPYLEQRPQEEER